MAYRDYGPSEGHARDYGRYGNGSGPGAGLGRGNTRPIEPLDDRRHRGYHPVSHSNRRYAGHHHHNDIAPYNSPAHRQLPSRYPTPSSARSNSERDSPRDLFDERSNPHEELVKTYDYSSISKQNHFKTTMDSYKIDDSKPVRSYRIVYDPDLKKDPAKGSKPQYVFADTKKTTPPLDPRNKTHPAFVEYHHHRPHRRPHSSLPIPKYKYDKYSVGPEPCGQLVVWNFPITTSLVIIRNNFAPYGKIAELKGIDDPLTGVPLGLCLLTFGGDIESAHESAVKAVNEANRRIKVGGSVIKCGINVDDKLHNQVYNKILEAKKLSLKKEQERKRREMELEKQKQQQQSRLTARTKREEQPPPRKENVPPKPLAPPKELPLSEIFGSSQTTTSAEIEPVKLSSHDRHIRPLSSFSLPLNFERHISNRPFILIPDKYVSTRNVNSSDIRKALSKHKFDRILTHKSGFYVVFNEVKDGERCFDLEDGRYFLKYRMFMEFVVPDERMAQTRIGDKIGVVGQAKSILVKEFHNYLLKDLREKIVGPRLLKNLESEKYKDILDKYLKEQEEKKKKKQQQAQTPKEQNKLPVPVGLAGFTVQHQSIPIASLSSFRRQPLNEKKKQTYKRKLNVVPMAHALNYSDNENSSEEAETDEEEDEIETKATVESTVPNKRKKLMNGLTEDTASSSEEDEMQTMEVGSKTETISQPTSPETGGKKSDEMDVDKKTEPSVQVEEIYKPSTGTPGPVYRDDFSSMEFDLECLQDLIKDDEDFKLARMAFENVLMSENIRDVKYWSWKQRENKRKTKELLEVAESMSQEDREAFQFADDISKNMTLENTTGCFRTQGYYKIPDTLKSEYLLHRRKVHKPLNTIQYEDESEAAAAQANNVHSSRVNRANNRRFAADISAQKQMLGSETDLLDLNQLTKRKKPVQFARSAIHNWGLYALEPIAAREMIIEYVGERIRQQVAEVREKRYLRSGIGSSYLFRIDENTVIDASKKGGIARFINHCCVPSCTAKIIKVEGKKRIVIYALRDISANEELTYDYKFERETNDEERIPCLCGAPGCKGYLN